MTKKELVAAVAREAGLSKKDADAAVAAVLDSISGALTAGDKVQLIGFGTFEVKHRAARSGYNPRTHKSIEIPASNVPVFKPAKALKDKV